MQEAKKDMHKRKQGINLAKISGLSLLGLGVAALITSIIYSSQILAFIGLGLIFWGIILIYIQTEEYVKEILLDKSVLPLLTTMDKIIQELNYRGRAVYLPPRYHTDPEANLAYIPRHRDGKLPKPEQIQEREDKLFIENPQGILLTPPGDELTKLLEKTLETSFTRTDLRYLQQKLPAVFIEDLEIAQNFEMEITENNVIVKIEKSNYKDLTLEPVNLRSGLGCPISSAIACAIAKATGKPTIIEDLKMSQDGKKIEIEYRLLEEGNES